MNQDANTPADTTRQSTPAERGSIDPAGANQPRSDVDDVRNENAATRNDRDVTAGNDQENFLPQDRMDDLRDRWSDVQAQFVDDPQSAVEKAQNLVSQLVDELTQTFSRERSTLESQWQGGNVDTEALRVALQRYRALFNRLLST